MNAWIIADVAIGVATFVRDVVVATGGIALIVGLSFLLVGVLHDIGRYDDMEES